jgi:hypothetical protein
MPAPGCSTGQTAGKREKKALRNDRFLLIPDADQAIRKDVLRDRLKRELEHFFMGVVLDSGKTLTFLGWKGPRKAEDAIRQAAR